LRAASGLGIAEHVDSNPGFDRGVRADTIDGLLHLPVTAVATVDGVGSRRQHLVIEEGERLFQVG
jgi:hypothetical protein